VREYERLASAVRVEQLVIFCIDRSHDLFKLVRDEFIDQIEMLKAEVRID